MLAFRDSIGSVVFLQNSGNLLLRRMFLCFKLATSHFHPPDFRWENSSIHISLLYQGSG